VNALHPASHQGRDIASLWWWMLFAAGIGLCTIVGLLVAAWLRRNRRGPRESVSEQIVVALGVAVPIAVITALFFVSDVFVIRTTQAPAASATRVAVQVIGHEWWWEVRYPGTRAVTANEIHIPVGTPVLLQATTADVIHSFWVPELNRKIDTIPGRVNSIVLDAQKAGVYRGQCAEYCGLQHAHMALAVYAEPAARFRRWLAHQAAPAERSSSLFLAEPCADCHAIRGTSADGMVGPDLTHLASRATIGALTLANNRANVAAWLVDNQHFKPGNRMPDLRLNAPTLRALVDYLESLR
jgi:cytochrome c oxidase subunit 2